MTVIASNHKRFEAITVTLEVSLLVFTWSTWSLHGVLQLLHVKTDFQVILNSSGYPVAVTKISIAFFRKLHITALFFIQCV